MVLQERCAGGVHMLDVGLSVKCGLHALAGLREGFLESVKGSLI